MKPIYQTSAQLKTKARNQLTGKYSGAILLLVIIDAISFVASGILSMLLPSSGSIVSYIIRLAATFIVSTFIQVLQIGVVLYFLKIACGQAPSLQDLFYGFKHNLEKHLIISLIMTVISFVYQLSSEIPLEMYLSTLDITYLLVGLPIMLVFMVAYIYLSLLFAQVYYLLLDFPNYTVKQLFAKSIQLMKGNMWRLFHLEFSFLPLILLSFLTCGIGLLWLMPYMHMASTNFYLDLMNPGQTGDGSVGNGASANGAVPSGSNVNIQV